MEPRGRGRAQRGGRARGGDNSQSTVRPGQAPSQQGGYRGGPGGPPGGQSRGGQGGYRGPQGGGQQGGDYRGQQSGDYRGQQSGGHQGEYRGGQQGAQGRGGPPQGQQGAWGRPSGPRPQQQSAWGQQRQQWPQPQSQQQQAPQQAPSWGNKQGMKWGEQSQGSTQRYEEATQEQVQCAPSRQEELVKSVGRGQGGAEGGGAQGEASGGGARGASGPERGGGNGGVRGRQNRGEILYTKPKECQGKMGTLGESIVLTANFFELIEHASWSLIHYEVKFLPPVEDTKTKKRMMYTALREESFANTYIFDGSSLFTHVRINPDPMEKFVESDTGVKTKVVIKQVGLLAWGDYTYIQVFNIIIRKCLHLMRFELIQRNYYDANAMEDIPGHPLRVWPGYFTSIRQYEHKIMMNVDLCFKVMRRDNCYDLLLTCTDRNNRPNMAEFKKRMTGSVVLTYYNNKTYRIDDVDERNTPLSTFEKKDKTRITYKQYYWERYKIKIQVDNQPLLVSKTANREIRAGMPDTIVLVPELCQLTGLSEEQRNNFQLMAAMATKTRIPPGPRQQKLIDFARRLTGNREAMAEIKKWDLKLASNLVQLKGRVLPKQVIAVSEQIKTPSSHKADWMNSCKNGMLDLAKFDQMIVLHPNSRDVQSFMGSVTKAGNGMGWRMPRFVLENIGRSNVNDYIGAIDKIRLEKGCMTLVVAIVPNRNSDRYNAIKKKLTVDRGIPSQVIMEKQFRAKSVMSVASKIAIQMNCKLGGTPWSIGVPLNDVMVVGYDVCRDTMNKKISFGGMVASMNNILSRYYSAVSEHQYAEELSHNFASFLVKACEMYRKINGKLPVRILIYRDGVGDGQIPYVHDNEVNIIKTKLTEKLYPGDKQLKICTIVVTKRINTRLFLGDQNPPPGTVVDNTITLPQRYDFFLVPQCVNQGTVTPTSFNIIDSTEFGANPDKIQLLTYKMCHLYYNWSGTIRVPAPCQYAHKLAFLTSQSLHRAAHPSLDTLLYFL